MTTPQKPQPLTAEELAAVREWLALSAEDRAHPNMRYSALWKSLPEGSLPDRLLATIDSLRTTLARLSEPGAAHAALTEWWGESRNGATEGMQAAIKAAIASAKKEGNVNDRR